MTRTQAIKAEKEAKKALKINRKFSEICEKRLMDLKVRRTFRYYKENENLIKGLVKIWGGKNVINREDVEVYINSKKSPTQANKELKMIKRLFQHAVERDWLETNPAKNIKLLPVSKKRKYIPPQEDIIKFMVSAGKDRFYFLTIVYTLARMREINYLKWEDVYSDYLILKTRKARNSDLTERRIPINEILKYILEQLPKKGEYVFCQNNGKPYDCRKRLMAGICKRAGIKRFSFHSLRHYGASKLAEAGAPLTAIQAILGHSRATTTDTYLQSLGMKKTEVMNSLTIKSPP
ncbi:tyrosine-type recombinase/integrase [Desulfobacterium sp. N47]